MHILLLLSLCWLVSARLTLNRTQWRVQEYRSLLSWPPLPQGTPLFTAPTIDPYQYTYGPQYSVQGPAVWVRIGQDCTPTLKPYIQNYTQVVGQVAKVSIVLTNWSLAAQNCYNLRHLVHQVYMFGKKTFQTYGYPPPGLLLVSSWYVDETYSAAGSPEAELSSIHNYPDWDAMPVAWWKRSDSLTFLSSDYTNDMDVPVWVQVDREPGPWNITDGELWALLFYWTNIVLCVMTILCGGYLLGVRMLNKDLHLDVRLFVVVCGWVASMLQLVAMLLPYLSPVRILIHTWPGVLTFAGFTVMLYMWSKVLSHTRGASSPLVVRLVVLVSLLALCGTFIFRLVFISTLYDTMHAVGAMVVTALLISLQVTQALAFLFYGCLFRRRASQELVSASTQNILNKLTRLSIIGFITFMGTGAINLAVQAIPGCKFQPLPFLLGVRLFDLLSVVRCATLLFLLGASTQVRTTNRRRFGLFFETQSVQAKWRRWTMHASQMQPIIERPTSEKSSLSSIAEIQVMDEE